MRVARQIDLADCGVLECAGSLRDERRRRGKILSLFEALAGCSAREAEKPNEFGENGELAGIILTVNYTGGLTCAADRGNTAIRLTVRPRGAQQSWPKPHRKARYRASSVWRQYQPTVRRCGAPLRRARANRQDR